MQIREVAHVLICYTKLMDLPKEYPKMLAVAAVVMNKEGKILLHRRAKDPDKGKWQLFATYVKPGERLVDSVKRRLKEDGGINSVKSINFTGLYYDNLDRHPGTFCIPFVFKSIIDTNTATKMDECAWFSTAEAVKLDLALDDNQVLRDVLKM